jgi:hypothetical protein
MIENEEGLALAVEQLGRLYSVMASFRAKIPNNPRNFALYVSGPLAMINQIQAEIDEYTGRRIAEAHLSSEEFDESSPHQRAPQTDPVA